MFTTADLPSSLRIDWAVTRPTCGDPRCAACYRSAPVEESVDTPS